MVDNYSAFFNYTPVGRASDYDGPMTITYLYLFGSNYFGSKMYNAQALSPACTCIHIAFTFFSNAVFRRIASKLVQKYADCSLDRRTHRGRLKRSRSAVARLTARQNGQPMILYFWKTTSLQNLVRAPSSS